MLRQRLQTRLSSEICDFGVIKGKPIFKPSGNKGSKYSNHEYSNHFTLEIEMKGNRGRSIERWKYSLIIEKIYAFFFFFFLYGNNVRLGQSMIITNNRKRNTNAPSLDSIFIAHYSRERLDEDFNGYLLFFNTNDTYHKDFMTLNLFVWMDFPKSPIHISLFYWHTVVEKSKTKQKCNAPNNWTE